MVTATLHHGEQRDLKKVRGGDLRVRSPSGAA